MIEKMPQAKVHIDHTITSKGRDVVVAEGYMELVFMNKETRKAVRPPKFFVDAIKPFFEKK